jgi:hypothetical protein
MIQAQDGAARFYIYLTAIHLLVGLVILTATLLLVVADAEVKFALRIGGGLVAALGGFPSAKYLRRRDRAYALKMMQSEYERLRVAGLVSGPLRAELDRMFKKLLRDMIR